MLRRIVCVIAAGACSIGTARADQNPYRAPEYGWGYGEVEGPRTMAMAGAARAFGQSTSSIPINPANVVIQHAYHFEALFGIDTKSHRLQYGGAIMDSVTSRLGMGVLANKTDLGNDGDPFKRSSLDVRVAAAYPFGDKLAFGLTGHYLRATQDGRGPLGPNSPASRSTSDDPNFRTFTFDAGMTLLLSDSFRLGAVGYNLTNTGSVLAPMMFGGGLGFRAGDFTIEGNVVGVDRTTWGAWKTRVQGGLEYLVGSHYPLRAGYSYDAGMKAQAVSFGIGYVDQSFAIDAAMRQDVAGPPDPWGKALSFSVGLRYFYDQAAPDSAAQPTQF
ncbi:MAG: hypothetical protein ACXWUG_15575 [Polyangiales bacterium]